MDKNRQVNVMLSCNSLVELGRYRAIHNAKKVAYHMLRDGTNIIRSYTYHDLDLEARVIASNLQNKGIKAGDRALLLFHSGIESVIAFMGCLYAGVIAVPVHFPSKKEKDWRNLDKIASNAEISIILSQSKHTGFIFEFKAGLNGFKHAGYLELDNLDYDLVHNWFEPDIERDSLAFLQYTSGSTGVPKGVMVTHGNLLHNEEIIRTAFNHSQESVIVSWLPLYHDLGLIANVLQNLYIGGTCYLMAPVTFLQRPVGWLEAIAEFKAHSACAPNFAYELCLKRVTDEQLARLDLSSWKMALNGAEPVRADTLQNFTTRFARCGFAATTFNPSYGLAEATLLSSSCPMDEAPYIISVSSEQLNQHRIVDAIKGERSQQMVCSGVLNTDQDIAIVDPDTLMCCAENQVGEVWISGDSVAKGYWRQEEMTREIFQAKIIGGHDPQRCYLRTGDLGFVRQNRLFISGRIKDMIVVNGQNYYPQDIEKAIQDNNPALKDGGGAVFGIDHNGVEQVVVVQEVERTYLNKINTDEIFAEIRRGVLEDFQCPVAAIYLIRPMTLPLTSSGKIQRRKCKQLVLNQGLSEIAHWTILDIVQQDAVSVADSILRQDLSREKADRMISWLKEYSPRFINSRLIDERRCVPPHIVMNFARHGLLGMGVSVSEGGQGMLHCDVVDVIRHLGAMDPNLSLLVTLHNVLGIRPILNFANPELKARYLSDLAQGTILGAFALSEPSAGSNPHAIQATARPDPSGGWRVNGEKCWIGNAGWAGIINIFVKVYDEQGNFGGITAFVVDTERKGLQVGDELPTMGVRGMVQNRVYFHNMHVTKQDMLGKLGQGMEIAQDAMKYGRLIIAAMGLGVMQRSIQLTLKYVSRRQVSSGLLLDNPIIHQQVSDMHAATVAAHVLANGISDLLDHADTGERDFIPMEVYAGVKCFATEYCSKVVDAAMQLSGGRGYTENNILARLWRDTRVFRVFEGPTEVLYGFVGASVSHQSSDFKCFISDTLQQPALYQDMLHYVQKLEELATGVQAAQWAKYAGGELACLLLVKAFLQRSASCNVGYDTDTLQRTKTWLDKEIAICFSANKANTINSGHWLNSQQLSAEMVLLDHRVGDYKQFASELEIDLDTAFTPAEDSAAPNRSADVEQVTPLNKLPEQQPLIPSDTSETLAMMCEEYEAFICQWLKQELRYYKGEITPATLFADLGIDSVLSVELAYALQEKAGVKVDSTVVWNYQTVQDLASYIVNACSEYHSVSQSCLIENAHIDTKLEIRSSSDVMEKLINELGL